MTLVHAGDGIGASWSPDGLFIAYSGGSQLYRVPIGSDVPEVIPTQGTAIRPAWSPDGTQIAYVNTDVGLRAVRLLTGENRTLYPYGTYPSWRPDGVSILAYELFTNGSTNATTYVLFTVNESTLQRSEVFALTTFDDCAFFSVSPDGQYLVFSRLQPTGYPQVRRLSIATSAEIGLSLDGGDYPAISPDGEWVVYTRVIEGDGGLWLVRMDGSERRRLTSP